MNNEVLLSNIRGLCKKNGVAINALEKRLEMGCGTISRWNKANPSFDKVVAIADFFHISIDELSGHVVEGGRDTDEYVDKTTRMIIDYLLNESLAMAGEEKFWHDYKKNIPEKELMIGDFDAMNSDMDRLFYAFNEDGYYLLEIIYEMDESFDYKTKLRLYLTPDEKTQPVLECDNRNILRELYICIMDSEKKEAIKRDSRDKVRFQREQILKKFREMNQED